MGTKPQTPATYDAEFETGGYAGVFDLPYRRSPYYPLYRTVARALRRRRVRSVLEVGCGTGALAHLIFDSTRMSYRGFDFSAVAVDRARMRTGRADAFFVGDATAASTYRGPGYEAVVCTEVLEHIEDDRLAIGQWAAGSFCVCSVPNYDAATHVRFFRHADEVAARYGALIDIERIETRRKPFLDDLSPARWIQAVKWNRHRPDRLKWLCGFSDFDRDGGWYVFSGVRVGARAPPT